MPSLVELLKQGRNFLLDDIKSKSLRGLTDQEWEDLAYLQHDKSHLDPEQYQNLMLKALQHYSHQSPDLYRGIYDTEASNIKGDEVLLTRPSSFSEDPNIAQRFGNQNTLFNVQNGNGFPYYGYMSRRLEDLKKLDPDEFDSADGEFLIDELNREKEWILPEGKYKISGENSLGNNRLLTLQKILAGTAGVGLLAKGREFLDKPAFDNSEYNKLGLSGPQTRVGDIASMAIDAMPGIGDVYAALKVPDNLRNKEYGQAALNSLGLFLW